MAKKNSEVQNTDGGGDAVAMNPEAANMDVAAMNPEAPVEDALVINPEVIPVPVPEPQPEQQPVQVNVMTAPVTLIQSAPAITPTPPLPQGTAETGKYEEFLLMPEAAWPPPIFMKKSVSAQERFYISNRWHSQWSYYDKKATESKNRYYNIQRFVVVGSLIIPALVSLNSTIARAVTALMTGGIANAELEAVVRIFVDVITVVISLMVAGSAALESLYKYGDAWGSYRAAAEELQAEKYFYDMLAGPYSNNANPFATFVERTENIVAKQNGQYFQVMQQTIQKQSSQNEELVERYKAEDDEESAEIVAG
jgi:hypothetical protein